MFYKGWFFCIFCFSFSHLYFKFSSASGSLINSKLAFLLLVFASSSCSYHRHRANSLLRNVCWLLCYLQNKNFLLVLASLCPYTLQGTLPLQTETVGIWLSILPFWFLVLVISLMPCVFAPLVWALQGQNLSKSSYVPNNPFTLSCA